jgi:hypothetical protein
VADPTVVVGIAGIAGTLLAGGGAQFVAWRLDTRRHESGRLREARGVLRALRLIDEELAMNLWTLRLSVERDQWFPTGQPLSVTAWEALASDIAGEVDPVVWKALATPYQLLRRAMLLQPETPHALDAETVTLLDQIAEQIVEARVLIRPANLGGSTFSTQGGMWFPEVPELGPWELTPRKWRRLSRRLSGISKAKKPDEDRELSMYP